MLRLRRQVSLTISLLIMLLAVFMLDIFPAHAAETVPYDVDSSNQAGWWTPLDEAGGNTYMAYNAPGSSSGNHRVYVARRSSTGTWSTGCMQDGSGNCVTYVDDLGHNQPSIAVDGDGFIHAFVSMHNDTWRYYRSNSANSVAGFTNRASELPDAGNLFTYPAIRRAPNGDLYLIIRGRPTGGGSGSGRLYRWNNSANSWSKIANFAAESGYTVYPEDLQFDTSGNVHIIYSWVQGGSSALRHQGSYMRYSPSNNTFYNVKGNALSVPVTRAADTVFQPLEGTEAWEISSLDSGQPAIQTAKLAVYGSGTPTIAYRYREVQNGFFKVKRVRWVNNGWSKETVYGGSYDTYAALGITHNGTNVRIYYAKKVSSGVTHLHVSEKSTGSWVETSLLGTMPIQRIGVIMRSSGTDAIYATSPTEISSTTGKLYFETRPR
jgi:hypothetical protein